MSGLDIGAIRAELRTIIANGIERQKLNGYATIPDRPVQLPAFVIAPGEPWTEPHTAMSKGLATVRFEVRIYVPKSEAGLTMLDEFVSAGTGHGNSVVDAIESGRSLGRMAGVWSDVKVEQVRWLDVDVLEGDAHVLAYRADVDVTVYSPRS
mgnify:CR=1 FL=1